MKFNSSTNLKMIKKLDKKNTNQTVSSKISRQDSLREESLETKSEFLKTKYNIDDEFKKISKKYDEAKTNLQHDIRDRKNKIQIIEIEVKLLKNHFNSLSKDQRVYYLDILINGIDVR